MCDVHRDVFPIGGWKPFGYINGWNCFSPTRGFFHLVEVSAAFHRVGVVVVVSVREGGCGFLPDGGD